MKISYKGKTIYFIFFSSLLLLFAIGISGQDLTTNPHVGYEVKNENGVVSISYSFKDQFENMQEFNFTIAEEKMIRDINKFGVPVWMFETYQVTEKNVKHRKEVMKEGLFRLNENIIEVDKNAFIEFYSEDYCWPIATQIVKALAIYGKDNRRESIEMAMRFVQDIPYGVPEFADETTHYGGVSPPPELLARMFGDCDSKALLFTGIMVYLINNDEIVFLNQPNHLLTAIEGKPAKGQTYVRYKRKKYLIAETAGPGRRKLGEKGNKFSNKVNIEPLVILEREVIPYRK